MIPLKPYIWLDESGSTAKAFIDINLVAASATYNAILTASGSSGSTTHTIEYRLSSSGTGLIDIQDFVIDAGVTKVLVLVMDGTDLKGAVVATLGKNYFGGPLKPYCWIKRFSSIKTAMLFKLDLSGTPLQLASTPTVVPDAANNILNLQYAISTGSVGVIEERIFNLEAYDPTTFKVAQAQIIQGTSLKGHGTTSQDDADSSGDD